MDNGREQKIEVYLHFPDYCKARTWNISRLMGMPECLIILRRKPYNEQKSIKINEEAEYPE